MNKHIEDAMEIRNEQPMVCNCAQTILRVYAKELGLSPEQAEKLGSNFGGGMKRGGTCGVITSGLLANAERGGNKKEHCDGMIREAITLIDELVSASEK